MADTVIRVENLSKDYRLGTISHGTLYRDLQSLTARLLGKMDPNSPLDPSSTKTGDTLFKALDNVSFEVAKGEVLGIIGRNGAGKSTLLKVMSRVTAPTKGQVKLKGRLASLLEVGTGFHPELSGRENVFLNGAILGMTKKEISRKFDEIVEFAEVERFIDTPVKRYSSGMYVRLAFAVAAHLEPEILVVDEVLAVGDIQFQKKCLGKMDEAGKTGRTILFVSHNMQAISALCSRALVLHHGQIAYEGKVQTAIDAYREAVKSTHVSVNNCFSRGGSGGVRITNVWTSSGSQQHGTEILSGEPICINLELNVQPLYRGKNIIIGIAVDSDNGKRLFTNLSSWEEEKIIVDAELAMVSCRIASVPLIPGTYLVSVSVLYQLDTLDCTVHCAEFTIANDKGNFYASRGEDQGNVHLPCAFKVITPTGLKTS